jgi:DNA-directed RNA polymerase specialized sigma24 family protein
LRKTKREVPVPPSGDEDPLETTLENIPYPDEDSPEKAFEEEKPRRRLRTLVNAKMDELPDDQKRALYLVHFKKLSHEEASRHLGCSPVNSRKLVHRGMQNLVRALTRDKIHLLPSGIRESVEQVYFKGLSYQQTSRKLGCSEYDVKAMMQKGLQILKEALHEEVEK